jgi:hypothetical protein
LAPDREKTFEIWLLEFNTNRYEWANDKQTLDTPGGADRSTV